MLRKPKPTPVNLTIGKISSLVLALCKSHNFCIDKKCEDVVSPTASEIANITMDGGLFLPRMDNNSGAIWEPTTGRLDALLDGGAHMDDHTESKRRQYRRDLDKPCHKILAEVVAAGRGCRWKRGMNKILIIN